MLSSDDAHNPEDENNNPFQIIFNQINKLKSEMAALPHFAPSRMILEQFIQDSGLLAANCKIRADAEHKDAEYKGAVDAPVLRTAHYLLTHQVIKNMPFGKDTRTVTEMIKNLHQDMLLLCGESLVNEGKTLMAQLISKSQGR